MATGLARFLPRKMDQLAGELKALKSSLNGHGNPGSGKVLDQLAEAMADINHSFRLLAAYSGLRDRGRAIDIAAELDTFRELTGPIFQGHGISLGFFIHRLHRLHRFFLESA